MTARFKQHYNVERPHQGLACGNRPPAVALAERLGSVPARLPVPALVDPDRWLVALDGQRFVRKVAPAAYVSVDDDRYYLPHGLAGQYVTLRVDAAAREFVVEQQDRDIKRVAIKGLGGGMLPFEAYLARMCAEARVERVYRRRSGRQLQLMLGA